MFGFGHGVGDLVVADRPLRIAIHDIEFSGVDGLIFRGTRSVQSVHDLADFIQTLTGQFLGAAKDVPGDCDSFDRQKQLAETQLFGHSGTVADHGKSRPTFEG